MGTRLLHGDEVWETLRALAGQRARSHVAVAHLSKGAHDRLPLPKGSTLVVDASEGAVKAGQTDPKELRKYLADGVKVYRVEGLHAKVYVLGGTAVIGSANVSKSSEEDLLEAAVSSDSRPLVRAARDFVRAEASDRISSATLDHLEPLFATRRAPSTVSRGKRRASTRRLRRLWLMSTSLGAWDEATERADEKGRPLAEAEIDDLLAYEVHAVEWYGGDGPMRDVAPDQQIIEFAQVDGGVRVYPPCDVVHVQSVRRPPGSRRAKRKRIYLAREKGVKPMWWTEFHGLQRKRRLWLGQPRPSQEVVTECAGRALRSTWEGWK